MYQLINQMTLLTANIDVSGLKFNFDVDFIAIAAYVLLALGMFAIAKRRGISKPWLAWIPFGQSWILGSISDQYRYVTRGEQKAKRKALLTLEILVVVLIFVVIIALVGAFAGLFMQMDMEALMQNPESAAYMIETFMEDNMDQVISALGLVVVLLLPLLGVAVAMCVVKYMAFHDLFASCDPKNKTLFTVLGIILDIFGLSVVMSVFVLICKNKDEGMPPRVEEQPIVEPMYAPVVEQASAVFSDDNAQ